MDHHSCIHMGGFQHTVFHHVLCATHNFLCRLGHQLDLTIQLRLMLFQDLCSTEHHCSVQIMAAGVHFSFHLRAVRHFSLFLHRQSVHIAAQQDRLAAGFSQNDHQPCKTTVHRHAAKFLQPRPYKSFREVQIKSKFRVLMQLAPPCNQLLLNFFCVLQKSHCPIFHLVLLLTHSSICNFFAYHFINISCGHLAPTADRCFTAAFPTALQRPAAV